MNTKILCFYLPQFHETQYNNKWWGEGYTDWVASKNAKPLFKGHNQPRVPLNQNYYDLSKDDAKTLKWQADLAKQYGIYGFCIYHYWFPNMRLLEKPVEILRNHKEIDIHYSLCWDSKSWKRTWYADKYEEEVLVQQDFGDEVVWKRHFDDLLEDFKDERYIKIDNKPVFHIYRASEIPDLNKMRIYWDKLARENGFAGIYLVVGDVEHRNEKSLQKAIDAFYNYEPLHMFYEGRNSWYVKRTVGRAGIIKRINKYLHTSILPDLRDANDMCKLICRNRPETDKKTYFGVFADYDDSPRRQIKGAVYTNYSMDDFKKCLEVQYQKSEKAGNEFLYINAWNEWGESAYLEPDEKTKYQKLEIIREIVFKNEGY